MNVSESDALQGALAHIGLKSSVVELDGRRTVEFAVPGFDTEDKCRAMLEKVNDVSAGYYAMNIETVAGEKKPGIRLMKTRLFGMAVRVT